jgi:hypothetical protein
MNSLIRSISNYIKVNPSQTLLNFIPEFKKKFNPFDLTYLQNIEHNKVYEYTIYRNKSFEITQLVWGPKSSILVQNNLLHGFILTTLQGNLIEEININSIKKLNKINSNDILFINNNINKHKISNPYYKSAISLQIYSPPKYYNKNISK